MNSTQSRSPKAALPIAVDAMGGDLGPSVVVEGAVLAARELQISSIIVGDEKEIQAALSRLNAENLDTIKVVHAPEVITMEDAPSAAIRGKPRSSIRVAFELVAEGKASGVVSPGNTGAMMAAGLFVSGTLPGIVRPAIASLIPKATEARPTILLDSGANIDCHAEQLVQFALMGDCYARSVLSSSAPRVALLSNGTESSKGTDIIRAAALMLSQIKEINFIGFVEGRDLNRDAADVVVCDGFAGNIVLKTMEGCVEFVFDSFKKYVEATGRGKLGLWLTKPLIKSLFHEKLDPSSFGGAPLLGLNHIGVVCHGSSNSRAMFNAIRVAKKFADEELIVHMSEALEALDFQLSGTYQDGMWNRMGQKFDKKKKVKSRGKESADETGGFQSEEKGGGE